MEKLKKNKFLIIFLIILLIISFILIYYNKDDEDYYVREQDITLKQYLENEYIPVNISYDQMARIYLQDYVNKLIYDRSSAYNLLDEEYRKVKFPLFEDFNEYIDIIMSKKLREMVVVDYSLTENGDTRYFDIHDSSDNLFIFKEEGVMQYKVYFDRYTVNID